MLQIVLTLMFICVIVFRKVWISQSWTTHCDNLLLVGEDKIPLHKPAESVLQMVSTPQAKHLFFRENQGRPSENTATANTVGNN